MRSIAANVGQRKRDLQRYRLGYTWQIGQSAESTALTSSAEACRPYCTYQIKGSIEYFDNRLL